MRRIIERVVTVVTTTTWTITWQDDPPHTSSDPQPVDSLFGRQAKPAPVGDDRSQPQLLPPTQQSGSTDMTQSAKEVSASEIKQ